MNNRGLIRGLKICVVLSGLMLALSWSFASACGCGVYIPRDGDARVSQERAVIRWDGQTEDIVMSLGVLGQSKEAAVILPVPARATVKLGDAKIFDALNELTKPRVEKQFALFPPISLGAGAAPPAGAPPVSLIERQTLGPFDISTLAATDANALGAWLKSNGYSFPPELTKILQPYVDQKWEYVAIRLTPGTKAGSLSGMLDPLQVSFASDKIIYPMRSSALASGSLQVLLYVLADHRAETTSSFGNETVTYADWIDPSTLDKGSPLASLITRKLFLTKTVDQIYDPGAINDDYVFRFTSADEVYHQVEYEYVYNIGGVPIFLLAFCLVCMLPVLLLFALILFFAGRRAKKGVLSNAPSITQT